MSSGRFQFSIYGEPAGVRRKVGEPAGKRKVGEPAEKRREGGRRENGAARPITSKGQVAVVCENNHYRANDGAPNAREHLQRTFGLAKGSGVVFVPQVEAYEKDISDFIFADTSLTFGAFPSVVVVLAESLRTDRGSDRWVDKSGCTNLDLSRNFVVYLTTLSGSLPLALFVFIAESTSIGRSGTSPWRRG